MPRQHSTVYTMEQWLEDPDLLALPEAIAPRLVYRDNVTLLAGREKDGKSTFASYAAACVSAGRDFLGQPTKQGMVLWLRLEEPQGTLLRRLVDFGADPKHIAIPDWLPNGPEDLPAMMQEWKPAMVVVDTLSALALGIVNDPYSSTEWTKLILPLATLTQRHHAGLLLNHHANKSTGEYRDSTAIGACADHIIEMGTDSNDDRARVFKTKGRWEIPTFKARFENNAYTLVDSVKNLEAQILAYIQANAGCGMRDLRLAIGGRSIRVDKVLDRLLKAGLVVNDGHKRDAKLRVAQPRDTQVVGHIDGEEKP